jgi:hypothetical protein
MLHVLVKLSAASNQLPSSLFLSDVYRAAISYAESRPMIDISRNISEMPKASDNNTDELVYIIQNLGKENKIEYVSRIVFELDLSLMSFDLAT